MIGFFNAYRPDNGLVGYQERYQPMFVEYLERAFPKEEIRVYEPTRGEIPDEPGECALWVISGSPKNAGDGDDWIQRLAAFIQRGHESRTKIVGVCFGHQIVAQALGGRIVTDRGWGVGARTCEILKNKPWMKPALETATLLYSHHDQVATLPPGADHIGRSDFCEYEMFSVGEHIFCLQAHPEFDVDYSRGSLGSKRETLGAAGYRDAIASLEMPLSSEVVMGWIGEFL